jgi:hypothetical protein
MDLTAYDDQRRFEGAIADLIKRSELSLAEQRVRHAIGETGSASLKSVSDIPARSVRIEGWDILCADLVMADAKLREKLGSRATFADMYLDNQPSSPRLELHRQFYGAFERHENGDVFRSGDFPRIGAERPILVTGLEALMAVQRTPLSNDSRPDAYIDNMLAGHLLIIKVHQAFDDRLKTDGLPLPVGILLKTCQSRPENDDFGPWSRRFVEAATVKLMPHGAADPLLAARRAENARDHQARVSKVIAEYREIYRLVRLYPFYRLIARNRLGGMLTHLLETFCEAQQISSKGVGWRMSQPEFERLLRAIAVFQEPASLEDALDVRHVNTLHAKWLMLAKAHGFEIPETEGSLFELLMRHSLKFGGPIVQERWAAAGDYSLEAK